MLSNRYDASTGQWQSSPQTVYPVNLLHAGAELVVDDSGHALVVRATNSGFSLAQSLESKSSGANGSWGKSQSIGLARKGNTGTGFALGIDGQGKVTVLWRDEQFTSDGQPRRVLSRRLDSINSAWKTSQVVDEGHVQSLFASPSLAVESDGSVTAAWARTDGVASEL